MCQSGLIPPSEAGLRGHISVGLISIPAGDTRAGSTSGPRGCGRASQPAAPADGCAVNAKA